MATIEFAVLQLGVTELIVCGHSHCGAVNALHGAQIDHLPAMRGWLTAHGRVRTQAPPADLALREEGQRHVLAQVRALTSYPFIRDRVAADELRVHAWFYDIETGEVLTPSPSKPGFQPL
jgi:carbonic anhydrase